MKDISQTNIYISMSPSRRLEVATGLFDFAFEHIKTYFIHKYPEYSKEKILELVRQRISHGREKSISKDDYRS